MADLIALYDEKIPENNYKIFDPQNPWKEKILTNYIAKPLQVQIFKNGKLIYNIPKLTEVCENAKKELDTLWTEIKRLKNPHKYYVDLSGPLWELKNELLNK